MTFNERSEVHDVTRHVILKIAKNYGIKRREGEKAKKMPLVQCFQGLKALC
jgi:hypothetical protein